MGSQLDTRHFCVLALWAATSLIQAVPSYQRRSFSLKTRKGNVTRFPSERESEMVYTSCRLSLARSHARTLSLCTYVHTYIHIYIYSCIYIYTYVYAYIYIYTYINTLIHIYLYTYIHTFMYLYMYIYLCTHVYIYIIYIVWWVCNVPGKPGGFHCQDLMTRECRPARKFVNLVKVPAGSHEFCWGLQCATVSRVLWSPNFQITRMKNTKRSTTLDRLKTFFLQDSLT